MESITYLALGSAIVAGVFKLTRDRIRFKKEKLSTAYAFKGEISAFLDIIKKFKIKTINKMIRDEKRKSSEINKKRKQFSKIRTIYLDKEKKVRFEDRYFAINYGVEILLLFTMEINDDVFFIKHTLKDKIGLLDEAAVSVVKFYTYANSFLLDCLDNKEKNNEYKELMKGNLKEIITKLTDFHETYNIINKIQSIISNHKIMLSKLEESIKAGKDAISDLDKIISKNSKILGIIRISTIVKTKY